MCSIYYRVFRCSFNFCHHLYITTLWGVPTRDDYGKNALCDTVLHNCPLFSPHIKRNLPFSDVLFTSLLNISLSVCLLAFSSKYVHTTSACSFFPQKQTLPISFQKVAMWNIFSSAQVHICTPYTGSTLECFINCVLS